MFQKPSQTSHLRNNKLQNRNIFDEQCLNDSCSHPKEEEKMHVSNQIHDLHTHTLVYMLGIQKAYKTKPAEEGMTFCACAFTNHTTGGLNGPINAKLGR